MKYDKLHDAFTEIDDQYILEAHDTVQKKTFIVTRYYKQIGVVLACFCLLVFLFPKFGGSSKYNNDAYSTNESAEYYDADELYEASGSQQNKMSGAIANDNEKVILSSAIDLEADQLDDTIETLITLTEKYGGYIENAGDYTYDDTKTYSATIRVQQDQYEAFIEEVKELGTVTYSSFNQDVITKQYNTTELKLESLKAEYERVKEMYDKASTIEELILVEERLSSLEYEIQSYQDQLNSYDDLTSYASLYVSVTETDKNSNFFSRIGSSFTDGFEAFLENVSSLVLYLTYNLWTILFIVMIGFIGYKVYKKVKK